MTEFLSELAPRTRGRGPGPWGRAVLVLLWLAICLAPLPLAVGDLQLATGRTGTPGTLRVVSCEDLGEGRYDCRGWFTPDNGETPVEVAASPDSEPGDLTRAQLTPEGDRAAPAGTRGVLAALALPGVGLGGLGFLPYVILYWRGVRSRAAVIGGILVTAAGAIVMVVGVVAAYS
ncbi:hypothetical protein BKM31_05135 [[Actinomadura] parvosata subsp. kistnae]|uniref:Uncharacterized protein n=1 Tax=[Actinomadura] parvosata subsp. kistnae TaxID=1909395 RepID=A0A1V0AIX0_9ACTN|nr:hypothetical protein BKM31_05135 [Nonomuraea sp. ATCC 55076]